MKSRTSGRFALILLGITTVFLPQASAAADDPAQGGHNLRFFYNVTTDGWDLSLGARQDWAAMVNLGGVPMDHGVITLYQQNLGSVPINGPEIFDADPGALSRHLDKVRRDLDRFVPDPNYDGVVVIDYESWHMLWDVINPDIKQNWTDYIRSAHPNLIAGIMGDAREGVLRTTFENTAKNFMLATIATCKVARPRAKWGMFDYPTSYGGTAAAYDRPASAALLRSRNDRLAWLWQQLDVITPSLYCWRETVPDGSSRDPRFQYTMQEHRDFLRAMITESQRVANGKPVYAFIWSHYLGNPGSGAGGEWLNTPTLDVLFDELSHSSLNGVILWDNLLGRSQFNAFQNFMTNQLVPRMGPLAMPLTPPSDPAQGVQAPPPPPPSRSVDSGGATPEGSAGSTGGSSGGSGASPATPPESGRSSPPPRVLPPAMIHEQRQSSHGPSGASGLPRMVDAAYQSGMQSGVRVHVPLMRVRAVRVGHGLVAHYILENSPND